MAGVVCLRLMIPAWLHWISILSLIFAAVAAAWTARDVLRHSPMMKIMAVVWPMTVLWGGPIGLWLYLSLGRATGVDHGGMDHHDMKDMPEAPFPAAVAKGATHCGAGCAMGDIAAEWLAYLVPAITVWLGYGTLFSDRIFAVWILDFIFAFGLGIVFQYFAIVPMRGLSPGAGIIAAIKADALSLLSWQVGMYGFMAIAHFRIFEGVLQTSLDVPTPVFWFMMQIAMLCGFMTAYPVNWWLIRAGIKERM